MAHWNVGPTTNHVVHQSQKIKPHGFRFIWISYDHFNSMFMEKLYSLSLDDTNDIDHLKRLQRLATRMLTGCRGVFNEEIFEKLSFFPSRVED